ncbi:MAG: hypothetical protein N2C14_30295, partial [Planctomycetales bacterium]
MIAPAQTLSSIPDWHARFLEMLPTILKVASYAFRDFDEEAQEDLTAEVVANCLVAFTRLVKQGREDRAYPSPLAWYAVRQVREGRKVGALRNCKDVSSEYSQRQKGFHMERLGWKTKQAGRWVELVAEDRRTPVPEQAAFRMDFPAWLATLSNRKRQVAEDMAMNESTKDLASRFGISPGRVSQLRGEFKESWQTFHEPAEEAKEAEVA